MAKIYLFDTGNMEYLGINIIRQTSTGWHESLNHVIDLTETTDRRLDKHFSGAANKTIDEITEYIKTHMSDSVRIWDIDNSDTYEYW